MATYPEEYRYKIGDRVLVKSDLHPAGYDNPYKMRSGPSAGGWCLCEDKQIAFAGKVVTISHHHNGGYHIKEAKKDVFFVDDMFVGLADGVNFRSLL